MRLILRTIRLQRRLSLREVEEQSFRLAQKWGNDAYQISASWLDRLEREEHQIALKKLIALASIYKLPAEQLVRSIARVHLSIPQEQAKHPLTDTFDRERIPDETTLLPSGALPPSFRRGVIGRHDRTLEPMILVGSIVHIDTEDRAILKRREWTHAYERPIHFLLSGDHYLCGWCELDEDSHWLTLIPHPLSPASLRRWKYRTEIEIIGRVVAVTIPLPE